MLEEDAIIDICKKAFSKTIEIDRTTNVEAFADNITKELRNT